MLIKNMPKDPTLMKHRFGFGNSLKNIVGSQQFSQEQVNQLLEPAHVEQEEQPDENKPETNQFEKIVGAENFLKYLNGCNELSTVYVIVDKETKDIMGVFRYEYMASKILKHYKNCEVKSFELDRMVNRSKITVKSLKSMIRKFPDDMEVHIPDSEGTKNAYFVNEKENRLVIE